MGRARNDVNFRPTLLGVSNADGSTPIELWVDPTTHALLISGSISVGASTSTTPALSSVSVTTSNTSVIASNTSRKGLLIQNEGTATAYIVLGGTATTTSYSVQIATGGYYELPFSYTGAVSGITSTGTAQLRVTELT
jgi:hypothetical protein